MPMKHIAYFLFGWLLISACHPAVDASTAYNVAGSYQLISYSTPTIADSNPTGTVSATQVDEQHVNLVVKGSSGKVKISYSYANVFVASTDPTNPYPDSYTLLYKGRTIGVAGHDAISSYIEINPSASIRLKGVDY